MSFLPLILALAVLAYFLFRRPAKRPTMVCLQCGTRGRVKRVTKGSLGIEALLWLCFIVPGVIYSAWRHASRHDACAACGSGSLIPEDSPKGQEQVSG
jgi:hypothetical protein